MDNTAKIKGTVEAWESGTLGRDAEHAKRASKELEQQVDEALGLQAISIRLSKELIDDFKFIAKMHNVGYQPLMRDALKRFAEAEYKRIAVQLANEKAAEEKEKATEHKATARINSKSTKAAGKKVSAKQGSHKLAA